MTAPSGALLWLSRVLAIVVCLFLALFALDAFGEGQTAARALSAFLVHVTPMLALLAAVALGWRRPWIGGLVFTAAAAAYAWVGRDHTAWVAVVSGPLLLAGGVYFLSWARRPRLAVRA
jgi:hypothetical protein